RPWWAWVLAALALAAIVVGVVLLTRTGTVTVPHVVGQGVQSASAELRAAGLKVAVERTASGRPAGQVLAQSPAGGAHAKEDSTVALIVSNGPAPVQVPTVVGLSQQKAIKQLTAAGLSVNRVVQQPDGTVPAGDVISTSPAAGQSVARGSEVTVVVSSGPQQTSVPDVVGLTQQQAQQTLGSRSFDVTIAQKETDTNAPGTVVSQSPAAGRRVDPGTGVTIVVARAIPTVDVPDLSGQTRSEASDTLTAAGLVPRVASRDVTDSGLDGLVVAQDPPAGEQVKQGAPVRIFVGRFTAPPTTPTPPTTPSGGGGQ